MLASELVKFFPGKPRFLGPINITYKKKINKRLFHKLTSFLKSSATQLSKVGLSNAVIGLSGGLDSAVTCAFCNAAFGTKALAVIVDFSSNSLTSDTKFAVKVAKNIGIKYKIINAARVFKDSLKLVSHQSTMMRLHFRTRLINNIIFQVADNKSAIVLDTTDKSERLLGRHAECFYGHVAPLIDLYKSELYDFVALLDLPKEILTLQPGCPELLDIDAFGVDWEVLDKVVYLLAEKRHSVQKIAKDYRIDKTWLTKVKTRIEKQPLRIATRELFL